MTKLRDQRLSIHFGSMRLLCGTMSPARRQNTKKQIARSVARINKEQPMNEPQLHMQRTSSYRAEHAAQVIGLFALKTPFGSINARKASILLYLSERMSLKKSGSTITHDDHSGCKDGPAGFLSATNIRATSGVDADWSKTLVTRKGEDPNGDIIAVTAAFKHEEETIGAQVMSQSNREIIDEVWERFGHMIGQELTSWACDPVNLPEMAGKTSDVHQMITPLDLAKGIGVENPEVYAEAEEEARGLSSLDWELTRP